MGHVAPIRSLSLHQVNLRTSFLCPGTCLLLVSGSNDGSLRVWNIKSQRCEGNIDAHRDDVLTCVGSDDGMMVVSGGKDRMVRLWQLVERKKRGRDSGSGPPQRKFASMADLPATSVVTTLLMPSDGYILAGTAHGVLLIWQLVSGSWKELLSHRVGETAITAMVVHIYFHLFLLT